MTQYFLLNVPSLAIGIIMVGGMVVFSVIGVLIVRKIAPHHKLRGHHDVAGPIFCTLGVIYAVLLTFVTVMVWGQFDRSRQNVEEEANSLVGIYRASEAFAPEFKEKVRAYIKEYAQVVINDEWKTICRGESCPLVDDILKNMWALFTGYTPRRGAEEIFFGEAVHKFSSLEELRAIRMLDSRMGIPALMWVTLILGGVVTVAFTFFFGVENLKTQVVMAGMLATIVALMLFTIMCMDFPFTGDIRITPEAFRQIIMK